MENYENIKELLEEYLNNENKNEEINIENLPYTDENKLEENEKQYYIKIGEKIISERKYAVVTMAGGQRN